MDICSSKLNDIFKKEKPEIVNHHAAQISVPISVKDPLFDAKTNIMGLINVLEACRKN
jgi:UDP-glucose 4-epimerase